MACICFCYKTSKVPSCNTAKTALQTAQYLYILSRQIAQKHYLENLAIRTVRPQQNTGKRHVHVFWKGRKDHQNLLQVCIIPYPRAREEGMGW